MHPILFKIPFIHIPIYSYGVMLGFAFIAGWYVGMHLTAREGIAYRTTVWAYGMVVVFALIGARIAHIISNPQTAQVYGLFHALFASKCEGLVAYGGYIGGVLAAWVYSRIRGIDFWSLADCSTPSMVLGLGFTRIGCFLAGCCHGKVTDLPWGMVFPAGAQASRNPECIPAGAIPGTVPSLPVHPTQLYESAVGFLLFPIAWYLVKRRKFTGQAFLVMVVSYGIARFLLEFIRADSDRGTVFRIFSTSQFIGLVLVPLAIGLYWWRAKHAPAPPVPLTKEQVHQSLVEQGVLVGSDNTRQGKKKRKR